MTADSEPGIYPAGTSNILLLAPAISDSADEACRNLLTDTPPRATNLLVVSYLQSPDRWVENWRRHVDALPSNTGYVYMGGFGRSTKAQTVTADTNGSLVAQAVASPSDLTELDIAVSKYLTSWSNNENKTVVCFQSVTALLQYVDSKLAYRFLNVVTRKVKAVNGVGHFHFDPDAHDDQTCNRLASLFDVVAESGTDGLTWQKTR